MLAVGAAGGAAAPVAAPHFVIEEDSLCRKAFALVPGIGAIFGCIQEISLLKKIRVEDNSEKVINLTKVKNDYKAISIVRELILTAFIISSVATGLFATNFIGLGVVCLFIAGIHAYKYHHNRKAIEKIRRSNGMVMVEIK